MNRFFIYEEYGAKYEMMIKDVATAHETIPKWEMYQKGLEALALSLGSVNSAIDDSRKALTVSDLLVKVRAITKHLGHLQNFLANERKAHTENLQVPVALF